MPSPVCTVIPEGAPSAAAIANASAWSLGDVLLFEAVGSSHVIAWVQARRQYSRSAAKWSHAAIYVGDGLIVEAIKGVGVVSRGLHAYSVERCVLRLHCGRLTAAERAGVVEEARKQVGQPYSSKKVYYLAASLLARRGRYERRRTEDEIRRVEALIVCSDVIQMAYIVGASRHAAPNAQHYRGAQAITPAALAMSEIFTRHLVTPCAVP